MQAISSGGLEHGSKVGAASSGGPQNANPTGFDEVVQFGVVLWMAFLGGCYHFSLLWSWKIGMPRGSDAAVVAADLPKATSPALKTKEECQVAKGVVEQR